MDVLIVLVFVSLLLVCGGMLLLFVALHQRDFEHAERLSLLPLEEPAAPESRRNARTLGNAGANGTEQLLRIDPTNHVRP